MSLSPDPNAPETLSLLDIAAWQFKDLAARKPRIIAGIPSLQRGAVWNAGQVELLWDSIFRGFPIGSLVVCQKLTTQKTRSGKYGSGWNEEDFTRHLLDGQQRCNAIALGFLNALKCSGNEMPPAALWLDLAPTIPKGSTRRFLFRMLTTSQPWGYGSSDAAPYLGVSAIRQAVEQYTGGKRPDIVQAWPFESKSPLPLSWLTEEIFKNELTGDALWREILRKCKELAGSHWADVAIHHIENHLRSSNEHIADIERGLLNAASFRLLALEVPPSAFDEKSAQDASGEGDNNENRIYNVEHLFQRLNSGGTELRGEELAFSMIKAYWPGIEQSFSAIRDKYGNSCLPMPGSRLAALGARSALVDFGQYAGKDVLPPALGIGRIRSLAKDPSSKEDRERLQEYLGINHCEIQADPENSNLHINLRQIDQWLLCDQWTDLDCGLPPVLRVALAKDAPDIFLLLLSFAQKVQRDNYSQEQILAIRKPILGLATALHWFGDHRAEAVGRIYSACFRQEVLTPASFDGLLKTCLQTPTGRREVLKLLSPNALSALIPEASATDNNLKEWRAHQQIVMTESDQTVRDELHRNEWEFFDRARRSNALLLYAQRRFLSSRFANFDPSNVDIWSGHNRPWDYDHILPADALATNRGEFREACRQWSNTIGNLRAWPLEKNRGRHHELANASIMPEEFADSLICNKEQCDDFSLTRNEIGNPAKVVRFMNAARSRFIAIYEDWFNSLEIGKLLAE